jgi:D-inositol-3-phosphate glycosyltransferase
MHIALLSVHTSPLARLGGKEAGGMNVYVRESARELARHGAQVDIFTRASAPDVPPVESPAPGVRLVHLPAGPLAPYDKNLILDHLDEFTGGARAFAAEQGITYDIIHSHYFVSGAAALRLRQHWRVPIVQMFHTLGALKNRVARSAEETETSQRVAVERQLLREVDAVVAATPIDREHMLAHYEADAARIHIIPPGVDTIFFQPQPQAAVRARLGLPHDKRLLLWVGRMEPLKGGDALIEAVARLRTWQPELARQVQVLMIGGEPADQPERWNTEQRRLATLCADLDVNDAVRFLGAQPHNSLPAFYVAADALVMPSYYESFGMVALEAMACGTPVIASAVGGLSVLIEDEVNGLLVPPADPDRLATRLIDLLTDKARAATLAQAAHQRAARYAWSRIAQDLCTLYRSLIG